MPERLTYNSLPPLVSVIIPTYNRASFLERAIESVLSQNYMSIEILVVDDGSTDNTKERLEALYSGNPQVRYLRHSVNKGAQAARNTGIYASKGSLIAFLDSDNEWLPGKMERQVRLFSTGESERLAVVYGGYREMLDDGRHFDRYPTLKGNIYETTLKQWVCDINTMVVKKSILETSGLMDERIRAYQEWDLCICLARYGTFAYVDELVAIYHHHQAPTISKTRELTAYGYLDVVKAHKKEIINHCGYGTLCRHYLRIGHHFMLANRISMARTFFFRAFSYAPHNFMAISLLATSFLGYNRYMMLHNKKKKLLGKD